MVRDGPVRGKRHVISLYLERGDDVERVEDDVLEEGGGEDVCVLCVCVGVHGDMRQVSAGAWLGLAS